MAIPPFDKRDACFSPCVEKIVDPLGIGSRVPVVGPPGPEGRRGRQGLRGAKGDTGDQGAVGPEGPQGPQGEQGPEGEQGPIGPIGPQGEIGPEGPTGGIGPQGPEGPAGDIGPAGPEGEVGPIGPQGEIGETGPIGPEGPIGPDGPIGPTGRIPVIQKVTNVPTLTPTFADDLVEVTAQAQNLTLANFTGTAIPGLGVVIYIKAIGAYSISYGTEYRAVDVVLPTTTVSGKVLYLAGIWNAHDTKFDVLAVGQER
jgi:hypothetical protein